MKTEMKAVRKFEKTFLFTLLFSQKINQIVSNASNLIYFVIECTYKKGISQKINRRPI
ncbi:hypothetical protein H702_00885 [Streptococcus equinus JB1]|uniref:Uncharacterized protein n=1 Tax=Streptococcus equinus JB1 TaxID=1294274 RepID=A0A091BYE8_STREI|nr:hypothetical protein H702_00885 [Streptococcus equinus JB1]